MALCSESTGKIFTFFSFDLSTKIFPAATKVSLLAIARLFPELIAAYAEETLNFYNPAKPQNIDDVIETDKIARKHALKFIDKVK